MADAPPRVIVFDMDETLGHFVQLGGFWDAIERAHSKRLPRSHFIETMQLYPEYVRPGMEELLAQLVRARNRGVIAAIIMYTNNQGPEEWAESVAAYFDKHAGEQVFDMIIPAYSARGRRVSPCRTSHAKSPADLLRCTGLPDDARICFIDDQYHQPMAAPSTYYIRAPEYVSHILPHDFADRYLKRFGARCDSGFPARLGQTFLDGPGISPRERPSDNSQDTTGWLRAHISRFLAMTRPGVSRRPMRRGTSRRRGSGMTRRRRHSLMWS